MPDKKPCLIQFNRIVKDYHPRPNVDVLQNFMRSRNFLPRSEIANHFRKLVMVSQIGFLP